MRVSLLGLPRRPGPHEARAGPPGSAVNRGVVIRPGGPGLPRRPARAEGASSPHHGGCHKRVVRIDSPALALLTDGLLLPEQCDHPLPVGAPLRLFGVPETDRPMSRG